MLNDKNLKIKFQKLTEPDPVFFEYQVRWNSDPSIKYNISPNFQAAELPDPTTKQLADDFSRNTNESIFVIVDETRMIGEATVDTAFPFLYKKTDKTAWISILIGEKDYWRRGIGAQTICFLENICRDMDLKRIELGVFEFNKAAHKLYQKLGYSEIGQIDHFTYRINRWYADIRLEKLL